MAKVSPVSIKYMVHANFIAEGALEKPDVIGALFGQTEGLLGSELEMRELQKEGKIGRIEVDLEKKDKRTIGTIQIPTALDQSETTLIAAAIETIDRIGPTDAQIEVTKIEDVRGSKRDYIIERAKKLMQGLQGGTNSREISNEIKSSTRAQEVQEYGDEKLPCGDISGYEVIVVEGRADVMNLLRNNVNNVIAMNGTKLPEGIRTLSKEKEVTLFVDGDRGGKLIIQNVADNARVKYIAFAPDGKEVEELMGKEILMQLRKKIPLQEYLSREAYNNRRNSYNNYGNNYYDKRQESPKVSPPQVSNEPEESTGFIELDELQKERLKEISEDNEGSGKAVVLDLNLGKIKEISVKTLGSGLRKLVSENAKPFAIVIDGTVTSGIISSAEEAGCKVIVAKKFATVESKIHLLSF